MCWGRCQADLGHCCPGKGIGCTLATCLYPPSWDMSTAGWRRGSGFLQQLWPGGFHMSLPCSDVPSQGDKCLGGLVRSACCPQGWLVSLGTPCRELCCTKLQAAPSILTMLSAQP